MSLPQNVPVSDIFLNSARGTGLPGRCGGGRRSDAPLFVPARAAGRRCAVETHHAGLHRRGRARPGLQPELVPRTSPTPRPLAVCDVFGQPAQEGQGGGRQEIRRQGAAASIADFRELLAARTSTPCASPRPTTGTCRSRCMAAGGGQGRDLREADAHHRRRPGAGRHWCQRHKAVFQVGIEDRSVVYYHKMAELVRNGAIGQAPDDPREAAAGHGAIRRRSRCRCRPT